MVKTREATTYSKIALGSTALAQLTGKADQPQNAAMPHALVLIDHILK